MWWGQPASFFPGSSLFCSRRSDPPPSRPLRRALFGEGSCGCGCAQICNCNQIRGTLGIRFTIVPLVSSTGDSDYVWASATSPSVSRRACPRLVLFGMATGVHPFMRPDGTVNLPTGMGRLGRQHTCDVSTTARGVRGSGFMRPGPLRGKMQEMGVHGEAMQSF